jgi:hypothetical protein
MAEPSRIAAALEYLGKLRRQIANTQGVAVPDDYGQRFGAPGEPVPSLNQVGQSVRGAAQRMTSLDAPASQGMGDTALDIAAGFTPLQYPQAARDFERSRRMGDKLGMGLATLAAVPVVGGVAKAAGKTREGLEAAPTLSVMEQRIKERFGDFAQAYNLGLPDTPEYRRIVQEVTAQGPLSDDALREAVKSHPAYLQAGGKSSATELRQANRGGASALVDSLSGQGIKTRVETSKSPGSRSTYIYASRGDKTVKIRLSDHLPAESGRVYGANDIMTTPQHWKSAAKRALELLGEEK